MDIQPDANVEDQDRAKCGKNEAGGMESSGCRVRKHVGNRAADDRSDDAEHDCPGPEAVGNAVSFAKYTSRSRSRWAIIRVFDEAGNVTEAHEQYLSELPLQILRVAKLSALDRL